MVEWIDREQVARVLKMEDLIPAMEEALMDYSSGQILQPVRTMMPIKEANGFFGSMPAATPDAMGTKLVSFYPENAGTGIETHQAIIALFDPATGTPLAIMDGGLITEMRTAAVSAVATKHMAPEDAKTLAILGSGAQARSHLEALNHVRDFKDVRCWSRTAANAEVFAEETGATAMSAEDAVRDADVVVTVTSSKTPVLEGKWLKPGAHVNAIGACVPDWRELDDDVMKQVIIADCRKAAVKESGDIILSGATIHGELGEVASGKCSSEQDRITIFKSLGLAAEDMASARLVYDKIKN